MRTNPTLAAVALLVLAIAAPFCAAGPVLSTADENALRMLRNYMERYAEPEFSDLNNGYIVMDEMRSNKRGLGPRPLRFG